MYKLLNDYKPAVVEEEEEEKPEKDDDDESDDDILNQLSDAIDKTKKETKAKTHIFKSVDTGTPGRGFIRADIPDFHELLMTIINDLATSKVKRTRHVNRIIPVEKVCRAKMEDIMNAAGELFDRHFLKEASSFAIQFNRKCNKEIEREDVIKQLAELVNLKNMKNKVNLKTPDKTIIVEVFKGLCLIAVAPDYIKLKKYNLHELSKQEDEEKKEDDQKKEEDTKESEPAKDDD